MIATDFLKTVESIFTRGTLEQRDALRTVANMALDPRSKLTLEGSMPSVEETYRLLEGLKFSGDGTMLLPDDEIYSLESLLHKKVAGSFMTAVKNMAMTMYATDPHTKDKGFWPKSHAETCQLLASAFVWLCAQRGLENVLSDTTAVSHTRLPQFIVALQVEGKDEPNAYLWSLFRPMADLGGANVANFISPEYKAAQMQKRIDARPARYDEVPRMKFEELGAYLTELKLLGPESAVPFQCNCHESECECEEDEYNELSDFDHVDDLLEIFYDKFGDPDEEPNDDEWFEGRSLMEVAIDIPVVSLPEHDDGLNHLRRSHMKKTRAKPMIKRIELKAEHQVWHKVDDAAAPIFGDRRFAITLVSRHTCGVNVAVATTHESVLVAAKLLELQSK